MKQIHFESVALYLHFSDVYGWKDEEITVFMDDGKHREPTRDNIVSDVQHFDVFRPV